LIFHYEIIKVKKKIKSIVSVKLNFEIIITVTVIFALFSANSAFAETTYTINIARYGLENLNNAHEDFSLPFETTQADNAIIKAPEAMAVHK